MQIKKIAIVGGGTAGWLAANHLGRELSGDPDIEITVIESPDIPSIGVGEGTVPSIRNSLRHFGISEADLLRTCDASFKQGVKFIDWLNPDTHGQGHYYYHLFDHPYPFGLDLVPYWLAEEQATSFAKITSAQTKLCDTLLAPKRMGSPEYEGDAAYAYHFDAKKFAKLLADNATHRFGVRRLSATIVGAKKSADGAIHALVTKAEEELEFDFFVDCSGFSSILLGKELDVPFVDKSPQLLADTALTLQVPTDGNSVIPPFTIAAAHKAGWVWDITLPNRRGTGFVYSSAHMSEGEAIEEFSRYLQVDANNLSPRKIPMKMGYREKFWSKNCIALGLAQGFVEPLEATSILVTDFSAQFLARNFPKRKEDLALLEKRYNHVLGYGWDRVVDFIKLHYCLSDRTDTDFWIDNRAPSSISETLRERLQLWSNFPPRITDFFSKFEIFDVENYLFVLYGMKFKTQSPIIPPIQAKQSRQCVDALRQHEARLCKELPKHRELLESIAAHGLSKS